MKQGGRLGSENIPNHSQYSGPTNSPFKVKVLPTHDASKVKASGPGLNTTGVPASLPVEFTIDAKDAGEGLLAVQITVSWLSRQLPGPAELPIQAEGREGRGRGSGQSTVQYGSCSWGSTRLPWELSQQGQISCP